MITKTKRITAYPPKNVQYKSASKSTTNNTNEPPAWLHTRDYLLTGGAMQFESRNVSTSNNMRSASKPNGDIPYWIRTAMYGSGTIAPESPSKEEIDKSLSYNYSESKEQHIKSRIMSAAKQLNIPTPKPYWLSLLERV